MSALVLDVVWAVAYVRQKRSLVKTPPQLVGMRSRLVLEGCASGSRVSYIHQTSDGRGNID